MHPFGGTPICPRCERPVYAAEQVMGPGRKLYHKPCLACTICSKRLDSLTLLEHDQKPYCKSCHVKHFGTRDLRQANLPHRESSSTPPSLIKSNRSPQGRSTSSPTSPSHMSFPLRSHGTGNGTAAYNSGNGNGSGLGAPRLRPNRTLTPTSPSFPRNDTYDSLAEEDELAEEERDTVDLLSESNKYPPTSRLPPLSNSYSSAGTPTDTDRPGYSGIPRTAPLSPTRIGTYGESPSARPGHSTSNNANFTRATPTQRFAAATLGRSNSTATATVMEREKEKAGMRPLMQTSTGTGTRYGAALGGGVSTNVTGAKRWGLGTTPSCPRCGKSVYFAEQVKAVGKTYHKGCLRCTECSTLLDSSRLRDHDGEPICMICYGKYHGPQGSGYALLGKAGG